MTAATTHQKAKASNSETRIPAIPGEASPNWRPLAGGSRVFFVMSDHPEIVLCRDSFPRPAANIAAPAYGIDYKRLAVISMVIDLGAAAAVSAVKLVRRPQSGFTNCSGDDAMGVCLPTPQFGPMLAAAGGTSASLVHRGPMLGTTLAPAQEPGSRPAVVPTPPPKPPFPIPTENWLPALAIHRVMSHYSNFTFQTAQDWCKV